MATLPLPARHPLPRASTTGTPGAKAPTPAAMPAGTWFAAGLAVAGVFTVWPTALLLWALWTTDPLKSIGGLVPLLSLGLVLRAWRACDWDQQGTWWGFVVLLLTALVVHLRDGMVLELVLSPSWAITLPPHSLVAFSYASGVVLLFGGTRLWRAALFPLGLMLLVNPVPHVFSRLIDLPLQHLSAEVARGLAHALGQRLTPDELTLMFTPDFGMFIAPGCDGIRGSVTMGLLALVAGYLYRFRVRSWVLVVTGGVLLGYLFNLLRLCVLVLYYVVALRWRWLQPHAEMADYCLGAALFFLAAMLLAASVRRFRPKKVSARVPHSLPVVSPAERCQGEQRHPAFPLRAGAFAFLIALAIVPIAQELLSAATEKATLAATAFPDGAGPYRLRRSWTESLPSGQVLFRWAEYGLPGKPSAVQVGVSPTLGAHDTLLCHVARGEDWLWHGTLALRSAEGLTSFAGTFYNDGATQALEATALCTAAGCGQWTAGPRHFGLVYSRPAGAAVWGTSPARPVPVLLRVELADAALPAGLARAQLTQELEDFALHASFGAFTYRYRQP